MYLEFPCHFNKDESFLKDFNQEIGCLKMGKYMQNRIQEINDGSILIFAPSNDFVEDHIR